MPSLPLVRDYMDVYVDTVTPDMDVMHAVDFLLQKRITGAPVIDGRGHLVGILTETDCLKLLATGAGGDVPSGAVRDFMTADVQTIPPTMDIYYAAGLFLRAHFRRFPVVDDGKLVGAITRFDILRAIQRGLD